MNGRLRGAAGAAVAMLVLGASGSARAQTSDAVAAQALYDDAKALMGQKKYAEACKKLEESQRLDPGVGTHYALADCYEQEGKLATAWVAFLDVASESQAQNRPDRVQVAKSRAAALAPRLPKVTIRVPAGARVTGLAIQRDGEPVREAQWGVDVPVDPGAHVVAASAPGKRAWQTSVDAKEEGKTFSVDVPALEDDPNAKASPGIATPSTTAPPPGSSTPPPTPQPDAHHGLGTQRTIALVVGGVGVVGLAVGGIFGLEAFSKHGDAQSNCTGNVCNPTGLQATQDGQTAGNVSTVAIGVGAAALVGAAVLWFTAPKAATSSATGVHAAPLVGRDGGGVAVQGVF